jgi:hypothetical protein
MTESTIYKYYKDLPSWAKGVVIVGGLAMGYAIVTTIYNKINDANNKTKLEKELNTAGSELQDEINAGNRPTLSNSTLEAMSSAIIEASNDCGTDDALIMGQFDNIQNQADMLAFVKVFGLRQKVRCPFTSDTRESFWSNFTPPMSLSAILASELTQGQIDTINKKLATKGIKYRF